MVLLSIFYTNQIHGGIISRLFFLHFVIHAFTLPSLIPSLCQDALYEDLSVIAIHLSVVLLRMPTEPLCYITNTIK